MKRIVLISIVAIVFAGIVGADFPGRQQPPLPQFAEKKPCYGYTIIEFGKGINCHGDTIRLIKVKGGQAYQPVQD